MSKLEEGAQKVTCFVNLAENDLKVAMANLVADKARLDRRIRINKPNLEIHWIRFG